MMDLEQNENEFEAFLQSLKRALKEDEIIGQIRSIYAESEEKNSFVEKEWKQRIQELEAQNKALQNQIILERSKTKQEQENCLQIQTKLNEISSQYLILKGQVDHWQEKYTGIKALFGEQLKIYKLYQQLSPALKSSLSGIFRGQTIEQFLVCGVQKQNIELLWDAIKIRVVEGNDDELEELRAIFLYFFHAYNSTFDRPLYELQTVSENEKYDSELHMRTSKSRVAGYIDRVIFEGYVNTNSKKIERKSIVAL
ncbi:hypothetical protein [Robertmurraya andreesenii]|uniref:Uncharacterized protein n=1 Tax=Anoxybacillus andreesenii TaxID=1325932 RepID=A0ABT9V6H6_9BACL|nr:hypothetical protein [Robertmurraya andreesenii]MDQ0156553.1 hypothetical protein [Robertmurraya andreesenii]